MEFNRSPKKNIESTLKEAIIIADIRKNLVEEEVNLLNQKLLEIKSKMNLYNMLYEETLSSKDQITLRDIGKKIGLNISKSQIHFNLSREIIKDRLERYKKRSFSQITSIEKKIKNLDEELSNIYICPSCGGSGTIITIQHHREGRHVTTLKHPQECSLCKGKGKIK